jgi:riboflavin kinase/FMN adenylyltransferase
MEQWFYTLEDLPRGAVLAVGTFDGVHRGHEAILAAARAEAAARGERPWIFSFLGHPAQILNPTAVPGAIQDEAMQMWSLHREGEHRLILEPFTRAFAELSAEAFAERLRAATIFCGEDWRFGKGAEGSPEFLRARGFDVRVIPYAEYKGERISSTRIREALQAGQMFDVAQMLGRPWCYCGTVVHGRQLAGKTFGVPTCNIPYIAQGAQPLAKVGYGVYAAHATLLPLSGATETYPAVVNFGVAPTIKDDPLPQFEVHLLGAYGDYYGWMVQLSFEHNRLRPEQRFDSIDALKAQIVLDARACCDQLGVTYQ